VTASGSAAAQGPGASLALAAMYALTIVGFPLISTLPVLLGLDSQLATVPYRAAIVALALGVFFGWWLRGKSILFTWPVRLTLLLWMLLIVRMLIDTVIDPLPGELPMPLASLLMLSLGACFLPALVFLETPSQATLDHARRAIEVLGMVALLLILYLGLRGVFAGSILRRLATSVLNPISVGHLGVSVFIVALCGLAGSAARAKVVRWLVIVTSVLVVVASGSRGPILAALLVALVYSFARRRRGGIALRVLLLRLGLLAAGVAGVVWLVGYLEEGGYISLIGRLADTLQDEAAYDRIAMMYGAWAQFTEQPLLGSHFVELRFYTYPHNIVLESLMATGIVGAGLLLANLAAAMLAALRVISASPSLAWIGLIYLQYVVNGMVSGSLYFDTTFWAFGFACMAVAQGLGRPAPPSRA
jgi:O-antigen ligase